MSRMVIVKRQPHHSHVDFLGHLLRSGPRITNRWQQQRDGQSAAHKDHKNAPDHQANNQNG